MCPLAGTQQVTEWPLVAFWHGQRSLSGQSQGCSTLQEGNPWGFGTTCCQPMWTPSALQLRRVWDSPVKHFNDLTWFSILQAALWCREMATGPGSAKNKGEIQYNPRAAPAKCWPLLLPVTNTRGQQQPQQWRREDFLMIFYQPMLWQSSVPLLLREEGAGRCSELGWEMLCCMPIFAACQTGGNFCCPYQGPETW